MRRFSAALVVALVSTLLMAGPVAAGEITGNGKETPIKARQSEDAPAGPASSFCAFSGQNDDPNEQPSEENDFDIFADGRVQSFGDIVQQAIGDLCDGKGASSLVPIIRAMGPGVSCRGNAGGE